MQSEDSNDALAFPSHVIEGSDSIKTGVRTADSLIQDLMAPTAEAKLRFEPLTAGKIDTTVLPAQTTTINSVDCNQDSEDPQFKEYLNAIADEWILEGIRFEFTSCTIADDSGMPMMDESGNRLREERWTRVLNFKGKRRPYQERDRLTGTRFSIVQIVDGWGVYVGGAVQIVRGAILKHDTGECYVMSMSEAR
jgi:hypothetical protein